MSNWGIIGFGEIAPAFLEALVQSTSSRVTAIASISNASEAAAAAPPEATVYREYASLLSREDVEVVYIALVNPLHASVAEEALRLGKHVVCEKPLTTSAADTGRLISLAKDQGRYLLEAMWTRFLPANRKAMEMIADGRIGAPQLLQADFGFFSDWPAHRRLLNPKLDGGIVFDNTDYLVFLSQDVFGERPRRTHVSGEITETGVESSCAIQFDYSAGGVSQLFSSFRQETLQGATIYGSSGRIELPEFWHGTDVHLHTERGVETHSFPHQVNGFEYQIAAVEEDLAAGRLENALVPHKTSLEVAEILDDIHQKVHA